jgi:hypothetical protein
MLEALNSLRSRWFRTTAVVRFDESKGRGPRDCLRAGGSAEFAVDLAGMALDGIERDGVTRTASLTVTPAPPPSQTAAPTVTATGRSGERVTSAPAGINVATGASGSASFTLGTSITLSVTNGRSAVWSGACSSNGNRAEPAPSR